MAAHARSGSASSAGSHVLQRGNRSLAASTSQPSKQAPPSPPSRPTHTHLTPSLSRRRSHLQLSFQPLAITVDADVDDRKLPSQPHTAHPMSSVELASYRAFLARRAEDCAKDRIAFASIDQLHPNMNPPPRVNADHAFLDDADSDFSWEAASFMSAPSNQNGSAVQGTAVEVPQHARSNLSTHIQYADAASHEDSGRAAEEDTVYALQSLRSNIRSHLSRDRHRSDTPTSTDSFIDLYESIPTTRPTLTPIDTLGTKPAPHRSDNTLSVFEDEQALRDFLPDFLDLGPDGDAASMYGDRESAHGFSLPASIPEDMPSPSHPRMPSDSSTDSSYFDFGDEDRADPILAPTPVPGTRPRKVHSTPELAKRNGSGSFLRPSLMMTSHSLGPSNAVSHLDMSQDRSFAASTGRDASAAVDHSLKMSYALARSPLERLQHVFQMQQDEGPSSSTTSVASAHDRPSGAHRIRLRSETLDEGRSFRTNALGSYGGPAHPHSSAGGVPARGHRPSQTLDGGALPPRDPKPSSSATRDFSLPSRVKPPFPFEENGLSSSHSGLSRSHSTQWYDSPPTRGVRVERTSPSRPTLYFLNQVDVPVPGSRPFELFDNGAFESPRKAPTPGPSRYVPEPSTPRRLALQKSLPSLLGASTSSRAAAAAAAAEKHRDALRAEKQPPVRPVAYARSRPRPPSPEMAYGFALSPAAGFSMAQLMGARKPKPRSLARSASTKGSVSSVESHLSPPHSANASEQSFKSFFTDVPEKKPQKKGLFGMMKKKSVEWS